MVRGGNGPLGLVMESIKAYMGRKGTEVRCVVGSVLTAVDFTNESLISSYILELSTIDNLTNVSCVE